MSDKQTFEISNFRLKLLVAPFQYKEMAVNVEQVGYIFKYNIYDPKTKQWYSHYVTDEEVNGKTCEECGHKELKKKSYTDKEIVGIADTVVDMAKATIDLILKKDNVEELIEENVKGAVVVEALEENIKQGKKELKDAKQKSGK